jgi:hypothetical protein
VSSLRTYISRLAPRLCILLLYPRIRPRDRGGPLESVGHRSDFLVLGRNHDSPLNNDDLLSLKVVSPVTMESGALTGRGTGFCPYPVRSARAWVAAAVRLERGFFEWESDDAFAP